MTGDGEFVTGDSPCHSFVTGISLLDLCFTGVEASKALIRDVKMRPEVVSDSCE